MATTESREDILKNVLVYLGFDGSLPLGKIEFRERIVGWTGGRPGSGSQIVKSDGFATPGTIAERVGQSIGVLGEGMGKNLHGGGNWRRWALAHIVLHWPFPPSGIPTDSYDWGQVFGGRKFLRQGKDWEYMDLNGCAIYRALLNGEDVATIRERIADADPELVREHRAARFGDK